MVPTLILHKPHWPYMAPDTYHALYSTEDIIPAIRSDRELLDRHPVVSAFGCHEESINFSRDECRKRVIPAYMGLISELDFHIGRLIDFLKIRGDLDNTVIVLTSDHGDYLGDHWLGEKELFHEQSVRVPLIIYDPSENADSTRGQREKKLVESIDLLPTFLEALNSSTSTHRLEGRSLLHLIKGNQINDWRKSVFSEIDYGLHSARDELELGPHEARAFMIRTEKWKYIYYKGFSPQLFNLEKDPNEFEDLGQDQKYEKIRAELKDLLLKRLINRKNLLTVDEKFVLKGQDIESEGGVMIGVW